MLQTFLGKIFGTKNDHEIKKYLKRVIQINEREAYFSALSDTELQDAFSALKEAVQNHTKTLDDVLVD